MQWSSGATVWTKIMRGILFGKLHPIKDSRVPSSNYNFTFLKEYKAHTLGYVLVTFNTDAGTPHYCLQWSWKGAGSSAQYSLWLKRKPMCYSTFSFEQTGKLQHTHTFTVCRMYYAHMHASNLNISTSPQLIFLPYFLPLAKSTETPLAHIHDWDITFPRAEFSLGNWCNL